MSDDVDQIKLLALRLSVAAELLRHCPLDLGPGAWAADRIGGDAYVALLRLRQDYPSLFIPGGKGAGQYAYERDEILEAVRTRFPGLFPERPGLEAAMHPTRVGLRAILRKRSSPHRKGAKGKLKKEEA